MVGKPKLFINISVRVDGPILDPKSATCLNARLAENNSVNLAINGIETAEAMAQFKDWVNKVCGTTHCPAFVSHDFSLEWMLFVNWYFADSLGERPFKSLGDRNYAKRAAVVLSRHLRYAARGYAAVLDVLWQRGNL